jgi:hypothetical protein
MGNTKNETTSPISKEITSMTKTTVNGKRVVMTIEEKAALLQVFDIGEEGRLAVTSGSDPNRAYVVRHDGHRCQYCPCGAYTPRCAHRVAGDWYLEEQAALARREAEETALCNWQMSLDPRFQ